MFMIPPNQMRGDATTRAKELERIHFVDNDVRMFGNRNMTEILSVHILYFLPRRKCDGIIVFVFKFYRADVAISVKVVILNTDDLDSRMHWHGHETQISEKNLDWLHLIGKLDFVRPTVKKYTVVLLGIYNATHPF